MHIVHVIHFGKEIIMEFLVEFSSEEVKKLGGRMKPKVVVTTIERKVYSDGLDTTSRNDEFNIHQALRIVTEKYRDSLRPITPKTIYHEALLMVKEKKAATNLSRKFEGENEYQEWLKSKGLVESDDDGYVSQTGQNKFPSKE